MTPYRTPPPERDPHDWSREYTLASVVHGALVGGSASFAALAMMAADAGATGLAVACAFYATLGIAAAWHLARKLDD